MKAGPPATTIKSHRSMFNVQLSPQKFQCRSDEPLIAAKDRQVAAELISPRRPTAETHPNL
jgi:hypothetical protein